MTAWQMVALGLPSAASLGLGSWMTHRLLRYRKPGAAQDPLEDGLLEASFLDRYRPMARLLDPADLRFLASRPGYRPEMGASLRKSRRRIFRMYLTQLTGDFQRLHSAARRMVAEAPEQHADLIPVLMRQQIAFWRAITAIELRLALSWAGLAPVDAKALLDLATQLQQTLAEASPAAA